MRYWVIVTCDSVETKRQYTYLKQASDEIVEVQGPVPFAVDSPDWNWDQTPLREVVKVQIHLPWPKPRQKVRQRSKDILSSCPNFRGSSLVRSRRQPVC